MYSLDLNLTTVVTGGAGFIGSHVAEHFANYHDVIVCDNLSRSDMLGKMKERSSYNWEYLNRKYPKIRCYKTDLRDFLSLREVVKGADTIIHTAGQVAVTSSLTDPRTDFEVNALGTFNVLETARLNDSTVIFCSTNKVYGENVNSIPIREGLSRYYFADPSFEGGISEALSIDHTSHSPYGSSKLAADIYTQDYASTYGLKTGIFRMSCIYGERQFGVEDQGWLAWFVIACLTGKSIRIFGNGKQVRDVLYVNDLVDAFDRFVRSNIKHDVFNMGGGPENTLSLLELLEQLRGLSGKQPKATFTDWRPSDQRVYVSAVEKAQTMLGWKPKISPKEGVKRMVDWVQANIGLFDY